MKKSNKSDAEGFEKVFVDVIHSFIPKPEDIQVNGTPKEMTERASWEAFGISSVAAIPPGSLGLLTIIPELGAVIKIQVNLIYRIGKYHKKEAKLTQSKTILMYIFATATGTVLKQTIMKKVGARVVIRSLSSKAATNLARGISARIAGKLTGKAIGRWVPFILAPLFGWFSKSMTTNVGKVADELLSQDIQIEETSFCQNGHELPVEAKFCPECGVGI